MALKVEICLGFVCESSKLLRRRMVGWSRSVDCAFVSRVATRKMWFGWRSVGMGAYGNARMRVCASVTGLLWAPGLWRWKRAGVISL
jgi:hypothetical protein